MLYLRFTRGQFVPEADCLVRRCACCGKAKRVLGEDHAIVIELDWRFAQAMYLSHFFGRAGFRNELILSIKAHVEVIGRSSHVLGNHHPTTRAIAASLKLCFDEQLDWTLDDDVRKWLYVRSWCARRRSSGG